MVHFCAEGGDEGGGEEVEEGEQGEGGREDGVVYARGGAAVGLLRWEGAGEAEG